MKKTYFIWLKIAKDNFKPKAIGLLKDQIKEQNHGLFRPTVKLTGSVLVYEDESFFYLRIQTYCFKNTLYFEFPNFVTSIKGECFIEDLNIVPNHDLDLFFFQQVMFPVAAKFLRISETRYLARICL